MAGTAWKSMKQTQTTRNENAREGKTCITVTGYVFNGIRRNCLTKKKHKKECGLYKNVRQDR